MNYMDYEKLSDKVMDIGYNTILKMNVSLGRKDKNGKRIHYYKEFSYQTKKYTNVDTLYNINRNFDYYLSIEKYSDQKDFLMIRDENMIDLKIAFNTILTLWFTVSDKYPDVFAYNKDNKLIIINGSWNEIPVDLCMNKRLVFHPVVIHNLDNSYTRGVRLFLGSNYSFVDIPQSRFMALVYNFNSMYLFQMAQNMLNFFQRPEFGTNLTTYSYTSERDNTIEDVSGGGVSIKGGSDMVLRKSKKDIFDTLEE